MVLILVALLGTAGATELNQDNFDSLVHESGKHAFVKFFAPWSLSFSLCRSLFSFTASFRSFRAAQH